MQAFEYLSVLVSIVLGLGITQLLTGFGRWLEQRDTFRAYPPAIAWAGFLLLVHVQTWWTMFAMGVHEDWNFLQFTAVLLQPIILFLLAVIVFPGPNARSSDLRQNFLDQRRWFYGLLMSVLLASLLKDMTRGELPDAANLTFHGLFLVQAALGIAFASERLHRYLAFSSLAIFTLYIALLFAELG